MLSELGVDICKFETEVFSVRRYTDILSAERMDAEYFQPKYDKLISTILNMILKRRRSMMWQYICLLVSMLTNICYLIKGYAIMCEEQIYMTE